MSYLEIKKVKDAQYVSFVKKFSLMGQSFRISEHIGKNVSTMDKREYLRKNLDSISRKEFELRIPLLEELDLIYNDQLLQDVELMSIQIENLLEIKENKDAVLIEFAKEFIFNSNRIEGSKIPADEVRKIIETGSSKYQNANEVKEVYNSIDAMDYMRAEFKFNIPSIKRLYYILTKNLTMSSGEAYPRGFKKVANVVNNTETTPPELVESELKKLLEVYQSKKRSEHPIKLALDFHLKYEGIHPFLDGNGRTGRMLMNKILMSNGYFPIIIYSEQTRAYFNAINKGLAGGNRKKYYQLILKHAKKTYQQFYMFIEEF